MSDIPSDLTAENAYKAIEEFINARDAKVLTDIQWLNSNLTNSSDATESSMSERDEKIARRNQVLFAVAWFDEDEFRYSDIETKLRLVFPDSFHGATSLNVTNAIAEMANQNTGILKRSLTGGGYMLKEPIFRGCLRNMLRRPNNDDRVEVGK